MIIPYSNDHFSSVINLLELNTPLYFHTSEKKEFQEYLTSKREDYFVYIKDDQVVGCGGINYFSEENVARISWDIIHPDHHGKGIGKELMLYRIDWIKKQSSRHQRIIVRTSQLVFKFYQKMGFSLQEVIPDYWAPKLDLYLMELEK